MYAQSHTHTHTHTQQQTSMHSELISDLLGQVLGSEVLLAIRCVQHFDQLQLHQLRHQLHNIALRQPENKASSLCQQLITQVHNTVLIHLILILVIAKIYYTILCSNNLTAKLHLYATASSTKHSYTTLHSDNLRTKLHLCPNSSKHNYPTLCFKL